MERHPVNRIGYVIEPFLAYYLTGVRGLSLAATGAVLAVSGAGSVLSQLLAGSLTDRIGRRATLTLGMLANAGALMGLGYSRGLITIMAATLLFGVTVNVYRPASSALIADLVPPGERPRAYGLLFWAVNLGSSAAAVLGGALAKTEFVRLFWTDAVTCAAFGVIVWCAIPASCRPTATAPGPRPPPRRPGVSAPGTHAPGSRAPGARGSLRDVARDKVMIAYLALRVCYGFVYLQGYMTLPLAMRLDGLSPQSYGLAIAVNGILIVAIQPFVSGWFGRHDHSTALAIGFLLVGLGFGLTTLARSTMAYALTVSVRTLGEIVTAGLGAAIVASLAPAHLRGRYNDLFGAAWSAAYMLAPLGGSRLLSAGAPVLWLTCLGLSAIAAAGLLTLGPAIRQRSESFLQASQALPTRCPQAVQDAPIDDTMPTLNPAVRAVIEGPALAHLVTLNPDGSPQVTCVWAGMDGDEIVLAHRGLRQKIRNIRRDPRVAVSFEAGRDDQGLVRYLVVYGRARVTEGGVLEIMQRLTSVYLGPDAPPPAPAPDGYVTRIAIDRVTGNGPWAANG